MNVIKTSLFIVLIFILSSCGAKIFQSSDAISLSKRHKTIAILPPSVSIAASKKVDAESMKEQQKTESLNFQKEMYSWMLKRKMQGRILQEIQDIETTNIKLKKAGYPEIPLSPDEICEILGVDGVLGSNYALSKPMSDGAAIAMSVLVGFGGSTNEVRVSLNIRDCSTPKLIWNYDHKFSGGMGSSSSKLVDNLMKNASKKMPYVK
ncbi:hypothetical protein Fleli_0017 [Bernardetia litoralis DSM 6794]|uniref:DUF4410 domain-containing protein n=1 Tax=Bernardetia litoralis (strain ATCC 23117 / DSM 6794 / NBRC 15988 / NCIMB 1366 / Fx l1 / Sio-4) TaxID=880071 RepID=I4AEZ4_BERLS|nr:hypothetical protein [Bernardetia litoralis]AFM02529.1 hypothetical protein Fleli_0017 [Bernardetia litoralis DSM 6794]